jgi:thiol-disulfide isomerase/thioredoxin
MKRINPFAVVLCGLLLAGSLAASSLAAADWSKIPPISDKEVKSLVAKNKGKVIVLNFWATWCPPCVEEFPALVKLYKAYNAKGVEVIGVSLNDVEELKDVQAFLRKQNPPFPIYLAGSVEDAFYQSIDKRWESEMPLTMIYGKDGKLRYFHNEGRTYAQFEKDVQSLLK